MARKKTVRSKKSGNRFFKLAGRVILWFFGLSIIWVLALRFINPPVTLLMIIRGFELKADDKPWRIEKEWLSYDELSTNLKVAAVAGEDINFPNHWGFDFVAMEKAFEKNKSGKRIRGGSTISQQTAKNVFLWPGRSYIRKGFEAYFAGLIELLWGKERILEVYLNVIEVVQQQIQFRLERGTFVDFAADLSLQDCQDGTLLTYAVQATPNIPIPTMFIQQAMQLELPANMRTMRRVICGNNV